MTETLVAVLVLVGILVWSLRRAATPTDAPPASEATDPTVDDMVLHDMTADDDDEMIGGGWS